MTSGKHTKIKVKCAVTGKTYEGCLFNHMSEIPLSAKYWDMIFGEWEEGIKRDTWNVYVNIKSGVYYLKQDKK